MELVIVLISASHLVYFFLDGFSCYNHYRLETGGKLCQGSADVSHEEGGRALHSERVMTMELNDTILQIAEFQ